MQADNAPCAVAVLLTGESGAIVALLIVGIAGNETFVGIGTLLFVTPNVAERLVMPENDAGAAPFVSSTEASALGTAPTARHRSAISVEVVMFMLMFMCPWSSKMAQALKTPGTEWRFRYLIQKYGSKRTSGGA